MGEDKLDTIPPLGRSAGEIEGESGNRVNPSVPGERADKQETVAPVPVIHPGAAGMPGNFTAGGAPIIGPLAVGGLVRDPADPEGGSENSDVSQEGEG